MSMAEYETMLKMGKLVDKNFTARAATQCFVKVNLTDELFVTRVLRTGWGCGAALASC